MAYFIPRTERTAEIEVYYKKVAHYDDLPKVRNPEEAMKYLRKIWSRRIKDVEEFMAVFMNSHNKVLGFARVREGGLSIVMSNMSSLYQVGLRANARGMIFAQNHVEGDVHPVDVELEFVESLKEAGKAIGISVVDYFILDSGSHYSFREMQTVLD